MKKNILNHFTMALLVMIGLVSCNKEQFKVNVNLQNADENTMIYLRKIVDNQTVVLDSAVFQNENAVMTAPYDDPQMLYSIKIKGKRGSMEFFPENQDVTVVGDLDNPTAVEILGGEAQTKYMGYLKGNAAFDEQVMELYGKMEEAYKNNDSVTMQAINEEGNAIMEQQQAFFNNFIKDNSEHFVSHYLLDASKQDYTLDELKGHIANFTTESIYRNNLNEYIENQERLEVGQPFIDFTLNTDEGESVTLSEYLKGSKLTLVDFWASWCGPCRGENPHVVAAYQKYHEQGFNVLGVSLDQDAAAWQKAVADDGLTWTQVRDVENTASNLYLIYYIPSNFLIDENGTIVAKNLRGEDLEKAIVERL